MEPAHARLLCQLALEARERGLDIWASAPYRAAMQRTCRPAPRFVADADLDHRCYGLLRQLGHVGMLWLDGSRVMCRLEALSAGAPSSRFPGPERVRCLVLVAQFEQGNALRREGWAVVRGRDLTGYFRRTPVPEPLSRAAREAHAEVTAVEPCGEGSYRLTLASAFAAEAARAGQFLLLECTTSAERRAFHRAKNRLWKAHTGLSVDPKLPLLRRPLGFHRFSGPDYAPERLAEEPPFAPSLAAVIEPGRGATFEVLFKVVGRGTRALARMRPGEKLSLRAPLGRPVEIRPDLDTAILLGGGIGAGPLFALAQELRRRGLTVHAVLGSPSAASAPVRPAEFESIGAHCVLVTEQEDGLLVTQYLERYLPQMAAGVTEVFACGPVGMLREVARLAPPALPVQVLMEQRMACGMGVCRGCVVRMRSAQDAPVYRTVCRDGPAFRAEEVAWEEVAATVG